MNIFALSPDPTIAAQFNCDKHVVKMILELSQVLSTAHRVLDGKLTDGLSPKGRKQKQYVHPNELLYKATHINHPSAKYCRDSKEQYRWAVEHLNALCSEYTYRYGNVHKAQRDGLVAWLCSNVPKNIGTKTIFDLPYPAMPDECISSDVVESYRKYYMTHKRHLANWSGKVNSRPVPSWYK